MPRVLVVFDAFTILRSITEDRQQYLGECEAFDSLVEVCDSLLITGKIEAEYQKYAGGFFPAVTRRLKELEDLDKIKHSRRKINAPIRGLRSQHKRLIEDAVAAGASYFVTLNPVWLRLYPRLHSQHGLEIVLPERYVELARRRL